MYLSKTYYHLFISLNRAEMVCKPVGSGKCKKINPGDKELSIKLIRWNKQVERESKCKLQDTRLVKYEYFMRGTDHTELTSDF